jgi:glutamate-1-semialdehyde 2,1-aminomutase
MAIEASYRRMHPGSAERYERASRLFPSGVTHDGRYVEPFPLFVERSQGAHKWDADGNRLIDYWTGHGALLLGHSHPAVVAAVAEQMARGTHYGAEHELELRWAELIMSLFPSAERLRFTASGTEATMLAVRLARAYTGRPVIARFEAHFHGWNDPLAHGMELDTTPPPGVLPAVVAATLVLRPDLELVQQTLAARDDIAAVVLEPSGASYGMSPLPDAFVRELRRLTTAHNVLLICDEVVTGFRITPGGIQQRAGVSADLTTLAKILAGGLPGGAVGGREDIMRYLAFGDAAWNRERKIRHNGTFNANPLSAAAGIATLERVATGEPGARATAMGRRLMAGLNGVLRERELAGWAAYGDGSIVHLLAGSSVEFPPGELSTHVPATELKGGGDQRLLHLLRLGLMNHGVDLMRGRSAFLSAAHTEDDVAATVAAFAATLDELFAEI